MFTTTTKIISGLVLGAVLLIAIPSAPVEAHGGKKHKHQTSHYSQQTQKKQQIKKNYSVKKQTPKKVKKQDHGHVRSERPADQTKPDVNPERQERKDERKQEKQKRHQHDKKCKHVEKKRNEKPKKPVRTIVKKHKKIEVCRDGQVVTIKKDRRLPTDTNAPCPPVEDPQEPVTEETGHILATTSGPKTLPNTGFGSLLTGFLAASALGYGSQTLIERKLRKH